MKRTTTLSRPPSRIRNPLSVRLPRQLRTPEKTTQHRRPEVMTFLQWLTASHLGDGKNPPA